MSLINASHKKELREAGWHSRGYLPHFDGRAIPQFITLHLADSIPRNIIERWQRELSQLEEKQEQIVLQRRIEKYLDQGYGSCFLKDHRIAKIVQDSLLKFDGVRYNLFFVGRNAKPFALSADAIRRLGTQAVDAFSQVVHGT